MISRAEVTARDPIEWSVTLVGTSRELSKSFYRDPLAQARLSILLTGLPDRAQFRKMLRDLLAE